MDIQGRACDRARGARQVEGMVAQVVIETTCNQSMAAILPRTKAYPRFLRSWLSANYETIRNVAGGEHRDGLNLRIIGSIPVPFRQCRSSAPSPITSIGRQLGSIG